MARKKVQSPEWNGWTSGARAFILHGNEPFPSESHMKYAEAGTGRVFVVRVEDGENLHETVEAFAAGHGIRAAAIIAVGGADGGSRLVVGPENGRGAAINPMEHILGDVHEIAGTGTIFPDPSGRPVLHMHIAAGRGDDSVAGCVRNGVRTWHVIEIVIWELTGMQAARMPDAATGFNLLDPSGPGSSG